MVIFMLKGIPCILPPELLKILMEMGHGDEILIADGNFPSAALANRLVRCDGHSVPDVLDAVLSLFPLDYYVEKPVALMDIPAGAKTPVIWAKFIEIVDKHEPEHNGIEYIERFAFYERSKTAYAIVATGEGAKYANVILKKGVISTD